MTRIRTALALGIGNIFHVLSYRLRLKLGIHPVQKLTAATPQGPFFKTPVSFQQGLTPAPKPTGPIPQWHAHDSGTLPEWWKITQCGAPDIKTWWNPSRFEWALEFAQHASLGDTTALEQLNGWIADWLAHNPPYRGVNWKCGQETAIRLIHLALSAQLLHQLADPCPGLRALATVHLRRIVVTRHYAIAQDNNHGITEAVGMFVGGHWTGDTRAAQIGRAQLEERVATLVLGDGSFSLYSVNYHRMVLDTLLIAELLRAALQQPAFSPRFYERARTLTAWLHAMIPPGTNDAPNLGANDGTCLLKLGPTQDRDYLASLQRAAAIFLQRRASPEKPAHESLAWLDIPTPAELLPDATSQSFTEGGFLVARNGNAMAVLRYPHFRFRPAQADLLHLDFWRAGQNILRDAGTYSYADPATNSYFSGIESHNSIQFDAQEPMPRLGQFLFGDWPSADKVEPVTNTANALSFAAAYTGQHGARHSRRALLSEHALTITDTISHFKHKAVLRWRLLPGEWQVHGNTLVGHGYRLTIEADAPIARMNLTSGWESRAYLQRTALPVLEVEFQQPTTITTRLEWSA